MKEKELDKLIDQGVRVLKYIDYEEGVVLGSVLGQLHSEIKRLRMLTNKESSFIGRTYFVATFTLEEVELFLNSGGVWGEFSVGETILSPTLEALEYHYYKWNGDHITNDKDIKVKKLTMNITLKDIECKEFGDDTA